MINQLFIGKRFGVEGWLFDKKMMLDEPAMHALFLERQRKPGLLDKLQAKKVVRLKKTGEAISCGNFGEIPNRRISRCFRCISHEFIHKPTQNPIYDHSYGKRRFLYGMVNGTAMAMFMVVFMA